MKQNCYEGENNKNPLIAKQYILTMQKLKECYSKFGKGKQNN